MPRSFSTKLHWTIYCRSPPAEFARPFLRHVWPKFWHSRKLRFWYAPIPNLPKNDAFFGFRRTSISNCNLRLKQSLQIRRVDNESKVGKTCSNLKYQDTSGKVLEFPFPTLIWKELICLWFVDPLGKSVKHHMCQFEAVDSTGLRGCGKSSCNSDDPTFP